MPNEPCPVCGHRLPHEFLPTHMSRAHPGAPVAAAAPGGAAAAPPSGAYQGDLAGGLAAPDSRGAQLPTDMPDPPPPPPPDEEHAEGAPSPPEAGHADGEEPSSAHAAAPSPGGEANPSTKDLHGWLIKHRRRHQDGASRAQGWVANYEASRRRR